MSNDNASKIIEHIVLKKDFATTLIKEGWKLGYIRPNAKAGTRESAVFVFNVDECDEEKFDERLNELKNEHNRLKYGNKNTSDNISNTTTEQVINFNFDEDKFIDKLVKELVPVCMATLVDAEKMLKPMFAELMNTIKALNKADLNNMKINIDPDEITDLGRKIIEAKNKK